MPAHFEPLLLETYEFLTLPLLIFRFIHKILADVIGFNLTCDATEIKLAVLFLIVWFAVLPRDRQ